jgi:WD40 repeat protein
MTARCRWLAAACFLLAAAAVFGAGPAPTDRFGDPLPDGAVARMGTVRFRHGGEVWFVASLADGKTLLSIGKDDVVRWWEAASGKEVARWAADSSMPGCAALSRDRGVLAARVGDDVQVWDATSALPLRKLPRPDARLFGVACSPDGRLVATCGDYIRLWDTATGAKVLEFEKAADSFAAAAFSPDGKTLASVGRDGAVRWWDVDSGKVIHEAPAHKGGGILVEFSPDGKRLATYGYDSLRVWDAAAHTELWSWSPSTPGEAVRCLALSPDGKQIAVGCEGGAIRLLDAEGGRELRRCEGHQGWVSALAFSPGGTVLVSGGGDSAVRQWDVAAGKEMRRFAGPTGQVRALAVSPDGATVASGGIDRRVHLWNADTGDERRSLSGADEDQFHLLGFAPDGRTLTAADGSARGIVRVWEAADGRERRVFSPAEKGYVPFALSPDAAVVAAAAGPDHIALFDASSGELLREYGEDERGALQPAAFLGSGKALAAFRHTHGRFSKGDAVFTWDVETGRREQQALRGDLGNVCGCASSPDGKVLAAAGADGRVGLWNVATGDPIRTWQASRYFLLTTAFSPDGRTLATTELDGPISLWETATGMRRGLLHGDQGFIDVVAFSPRGDRLYSGGHDGTVLAWDLTGKGRDGRAAPADLDAKALDRLWEDLGAGDAERAARAVWTLAEASERSAPYLLARLRHPKPTPAQVGRWIGDLDGDDFETRERASAELRWADEAAEPALNAALAGGPSPEARRRIEELLAWLDRARVGIHPPEVRVVRAIEALEDAGTPAAREALAALADGPQTSIAREARESLERVRRRLAGPAAP